MWPGILFCGLTDSYWSYWSCTEYCRGWAYIRGTDVRRMELFWMSVACITPLSIINMPFTFILNCSLFILIFIRSMYAQYHPQIRYLHWLPPWNLYSRKFTRSLIGSLFYSTSNIYFTYFSIFLCRFLFNWVSTFFLSSSFDTRNSDLNQNFVLIWKQLIKYWFSRNLKACYRI